MATEISCPSCNKRLNLPDEYIGQTVKCPSCETQFLAEKPAAPADQPSPAPSPPPIPTAPPPPSYQPPPSSYPPEPLAEDDYIRRRPRTPDKPGNVQAVNILLLIGGIMSLVGALIYAASMGIGTLGVCCLWPGWIYSIVAGILVITKASKLMGESGHMEEAPTNSAILLIVCIVNMDIISCVLGIIALVLLNDPQTKAYYRG